MFYLQQNFLPILLGTQSLTLLSAHVHYTLTERETPAICPSDNRTKSFPELDGS